MEVGVVVKAANLDLSLTANSMKTIGIRYSALSQKRKNTHMNTTQNLNINDALDIEEECRTTYSAWLTLEPETRAIMTLSNPSVRDRVDYCKSVLTFIDQWRQPDE